MLLKPRQFFFSTVLKNIFPFVYFLFVTKKQLSIIDISNVT